VTRDGGFPPLQMEPIDFFALYQQNRGKVPPAPAAPADKA
jgi:preprotein translocase subunit SecB